MHAALLGFLDRLSKVRVLDPACGSGNFLYISMNLLKDLEKEVITFAGNVGLTLPLYQVTPGQLYGLEINTYAQELAQTAIWIGYIQWHQKNGFPVQRNPVLHSLDTIHNTDAILDLSDAANPKEPEWPEADVIVGNPPFLGGKLLRTYIGDDYVDCLFRVYDGRVPREADLVCYWHEKARAMVVNGRVKRVGLLATQGIRGGANRRVLQRIKETGDIFLAYSDRPWVLEGAAVHVSIVGFDNGLEGYRVLDGQPVAAINANLTAGIDLTKARRLKENLGIAFMGDTKGGPFDIPESLALKMLEASNLHGKSNYDVIRPWVNGLDITRQPRRMWIIDFGIDVPLDEAVLYEAPFEYVKEHVKPMRNDSKTTIDEWWLHERPRVDMREALAGLPRYIVTPRVSKHRLFVWVSRETLPDSATIAIARDDDYTFGVLHSRVHEFWARAMGTQLREAESGFRYTPTTTFETFPFPQPTRQQQKAIATAAEELNTLRESWLNSPVSSQAELKNHTLTNLYNARPTWLAQAHEKLDRAVLNAYGWRYDISEDELLANLLGLNLQREPVADDGKN
jgi:type II restriction/modification system DNA methylase subunit YeeA